MEKPNSHSKTASTGWLARMRSLVLGDHDDAESVLHTLARTLEAKDPYTLGHADRVSQYAVDLGRSLGVNNENLEMLRKGGLLHDIGKIAIPDAILLKPGKYSDEEFAIMKRHPMLGCEICGQLRSVQSALPMIRSHHEKLDGSGYPEGLRSDGISSLVRADQRPLTDPGQRLAPRQRIPDEQRHRRRRGGVSASEKKSVHKAEET